MEQLGAVAEVVMEDTEDLSAFIPPLGPGSQAESGGGWCWLGVHCLLGGILMGKWRCTGDGWTAMSTHGVGMMDAMSCCSQPLKIESVPGYPAAMLIICGALVNGPYALITTAVSADLVRGEPQPPPRCPCTHRGCSLFPRGILLGFCTLSLFSNASKAQWRRAELSLVLHSAPSLKHRGFSCCFFTLAT